MTFASAFPPPDAPLVCALCRAPAQSVYDLDAALRGAPCERCAEDRLVDAVTEVRALPNDRRPA